LSDATSIKDRGRRRNPILAATPEREEHIAPQQVSKLKAALRGRMSLY
jgi:hypothetical protein